MSRRRANPSYYATDAQINYLKILLVEASSYRYAPVFHVERSQLNTNMRRSDASMLLDDLLSVKKRGWAARPMTVDVVDESRQEELRVLKLASAINRSLTVDQRQSILLLGPEAVRALASDAEESVVLRVVRLVQYWEEQRREYEGE